MSAEHEVLNQVQQRIIISFKEDIDVVHEKLVTTLYHGGAPEISKDKSSWSEAVQFVNERTPFGLILYRERNVGGVMKLSGATRRCHYYMIGNFTQVSESYKCDPSIFTVCPFHWCLYEDENGVVKMAFDRPRRLLEHWDQPDILQDGIIFDHKYAALLEHLGGQVPDILKED